MKLLFCCSRYSLSINLCVQTVLYVLQLEQSAFGKFMSLFVCRRLIYFYCLTYLTLEKHSNINHIYNTTYDKAVHPSWATSARSKAPKWACPCSYYAQNWLYSVKKA